MSWALYQEQGLGSGKGAARSRDRNSHLSSLEHRWDYGKESLKHLERADHRAGPGKWRILSPGAWTPSPALGLCSYLGRLFFTHHLHILHPQITGGLAQPEWRVDPIEEKLIVKGRWWRGEGSPSQGP